MVKETKAGLMIEYYVLNPSSGTMERKRMRLTKLVKRIPTKRGRLLAAQQVADNLNSKLRGGWTPLHETEDGRLYTPLRELREKFLASKKAEGCRPTTLTQYGSVTDIWLRWCEDNGFADCFSGTFLRPQAVRYMDDVLELGNRNRSYNNTLKVMRAFFQWGLEHLYCKENPFVGMKTLKKEPKIRGLVPPDARAIITEYYKNTRPAMNIVCQLVYSSAIRPGEIAKIQLKHIHLDRHCIVIPADNAKNHKERFAALTPSLDGMLAPILSKCKNLDLYLFGKNEELLPDVTPINKQYFQKSWDRMRKATGLPKEIQLYSLRDTGLTDLLHAGVDQLTVQHHADHSSLAIQNIYTDHFDSGLNKKIYENAPEF
ncbi:MAG: tyrosine-type recombinase/integrase [Bacteroidales bacterium]|nr:tyrosine-type recombinase/integrase [Bacteroidales bacterium]